jgi:hypothetical protein
LGGQTLKKVIAVENNLGPVKDYLKAKGCRIVDVDQANETDIDAIVLSGGDINLLGMEDIVIDVPVISADGRTPEEIWDHILHR